MPSDDKSQPTIINQTRFLIVDPETAVAEALRRFLLAEGAITAHVTQTPLLALRILQDRRTPIDCVICAHRPETISGVDFLVNLRAGRWGGQTLQHMKFILMLGSRDERAIQTADAARVTGYIVGSLDKENVRKSILTALDPRGTTKATPNFKIAPLRASESDLILAPFPPAFARLPLQKQQLAMQAVALSAHGEQINGVVAAVYAGENGGTAFLAPTVYHRFLSKLTMDFVGKLPKREIYVDWIDGDPTVAPESTTDAPDDDDLVPLPLFEEDVTDRRNIARKGKRSFGRGLIEDDIRAVGAAFKEMGAEEFVRKFVRHQAISLQGQSQPLTPMMREFFVSIELLRTTFFPGVEMRGSTRSFQSLTHLLDQLMLRSLPFLPQDGLPSSLNLNVHSILSKTFENALKTTRVDNLTFEIPQPMIAPYFTEFKIARDLILSHGGKIAVDQIFPDTIGALNLDEVGANFAKLHWKGDLKSFTTTHRDFVKKTIDSGVTMVMSRVDDPAAFEIAQKFGIQNFQGFLIDEMAEPKSGGTNQKP